MITLPEIIELDKRPPSVTVYMTSYNHGKYIDEAIRSVLKQETDFPVNIVIHDDASPDNSQEIIRRYAAASSNITAVLETENFVLNGKSFFPKMIPHLTGKYMAYLECDDFWVNEHKLQIQVDYLEANPDHIAVYSNIVPVNKFSERDESVRYEMVLGAKIGFRKTEGGDYPPPPAKIGGVEHQIGTLVIRNFWRYMTPEDIDFYLHVVGNGDNKMIAMLQHLGKVYHFSDELSAYRRITDEGTSYSARVRKISDFDRYKFIVLESAETFRMIEHFFGKNYRQRYFQLLMSEIHSLRRFHKDIIFTPGLKPHFKAIPLWVYPVFLFRLAGKAAKKVLKLLHIIKK
ncbi:MAG: glycosyltransferase [Synergistaceae bacterium]|nr:glycosyltransferase [Synergistaceae bacterium]